MKFFKDANDFYSLELKKRIHILSENLEDLMARIKQHNAYSLILMTMAINIGMLIEKMEIAEKTGDLLKKVHKKEMAFLVDNSFELLQDIIKSGNIDEYLKPEVHFAQ